jgi:hypothetical protein
MRNALVDLLRPAAPRVSISGGRRGIRIALRRAQDPRIENVRVFRAPAVKPLAHGSRGMRLVCTTLLPSCVDRTAPRGISVRYVVVLRDRWGSSVPVVTQPVATR